MEDYVLTVDDILVLQHLEMPDLRSHFSNNGVDINIFLNLTPSQIPILLPTPTFTIGEQLKFMQKYISFMTSNKLDINPAFLASSLCTSSSMSLSSPSPSNYVSTPLYSSPSINEDNERHTLDICHSSTHTFEVNSRESLPNTVCNSQTSSNPCTDISNITLEQRDHKPLLDKSKIGSKRRNNIKASVEVEEIANGVLIGYSKTGTVTENDRKIIVKIVIKWLLHITEFPQHRHYEILANKICNLFPTEEISVYYIPPKTEGENQVLSKGKLPMKIKNAKSWLRKKGAISPLKKKKRALHDNDPTCFSVDDVLSDEIKAAQEWLKRNREPFEDVAKNWNICQEVRLKTFIANPNITTEQYINQWLNILQQPQAYKLILDDFNLLHSLNAKYACLEGKQNHILVKWPSISKKLEQLVISQDNIVDHNDVKDLVPLLQSDLSDDVRDYIMLHVLSAICKPTDRVKVGKKILKPSVEEARDAFILKVAIGGDVLNAIKRRSEFYASINATVQPYIIVVGDMKDSITAAYVCINDCLWKVGSVLQAVDVCFKSFFALDAEYQAEAYHLWLFIQRALYDIYVPGERSVTNVTTLICRLNGMIL